MHNTGEIRRGSRPGPAPMVVGFCALAFVLHSSVGCSSMKLTPEKKQADPILGEVHPQNSQPYGPVPPPPKKETPADTTGNQRSEHIPPQDPLTPSPTSNAWLASATKPLPGSNPLAITDKQPGTFQLTNNAEPLIKPIPKDPAFVNQSWVAPPTSATSSSSGPGQFVNQPSNFVDPQIALLQGRGVTQHRIDQLPGGGIRLTAVAPQAGNPTQVRTFDVTARDLPSAVQAVIQQMETR